MQYGRQAIILRANEPSRDKGITLHLERITLSWGREVIEHTSRGAGYTEVDEWRETQGWRMERVRKVWFKYKLNKEKEEREGRLKHSAPLNLCPPGCRQYFSSLSSFLTALINTIRLAEISLWGLGRKGL